MKNKFDKKTEKLKDLVKEIVDEANDNKENLESAKKVFSYLGGYVSNGNLFQTNKTNEALAAINDAKDYHRFYKETYWEMLRQAQYWQNVFTPKNWYDLSIETKQAVKLLLTTLFLFGSCALYYDKQKKRLIPYVLYGECNCDMYGQITSGAGVPAGLSYKWGNMSWDNGQHTPHENLIKQYKIDLTTENSVFFQWNQWKLGAIIVYTPLVNQLLKAQKRVMNTAALTNLMMEEKCYFGMTSGQDQKILDNDGILHSAINTIGGKYTPIEDTDNGQKLLAMITYYEWLKGLWYEKVGRRFNVNEKQERNINSEVQYSQLVFSILEKEHLNFLQIGAQKVKEQFGIEIDFEAPTITNDTWGNVLKSDKNPNDLQQDALSKYVKNNNHE